MPNADTPQGLRPVRYISGAPYTGATNRYFVPSTDSTAIYIGGLVRLAGSADANGVATVTGSVATGNPVIGAVVSFVPTTADSTIYRVASTARYVNVADDPNLVFEAQEDSVGGAFVATDVGNVCDLTTMTSGSTVTGLSSMEIRNSTRTATGDTTEDVLIIGLVQKPDNEYGSEAKWLVRLNNHAFIDGFTGA